MEGRGPEQKVTTKSPLLTKETSCDKPTLPIPKFLQAVELEEEVWEDLPPYVHQAVWIGGEAYLGEFAEGEWGKVPAREALFELYAGEEGLCLWEPFLVGEEDPLKRFGETLFLKTRVFWDELETQAPEFALKIAQLPPRVWVAANVLFGKRPPEWDSGDLEKDTLWAIYHFFSWAQGPDGLFYLPASRPGFGELEKDPFGQKPEEVLSAWEKRPDIVGKTLEFFQNCQIEEWALLRFLANLSSWGNLSFWGDLDALETDKALKDLRRLNAATLRRIAEAFADNQVPPGFLEPLAQLVWPHLPARVQNEFGQMKEPEMNWLRRGGKGHFRLPQGRPSDSLILLMSGFFFSAEVEIRRGERDLQGFVRQAVLGVGTQENLWGPSLSGRASEAFLEMSPFARNIGTKLHHLVLSLVWSGERAVSASKLGEIKKAARKIKGLTRNRFTQDRIVFTEEDEALLAEDIGPERERFLLKKKIVWETALRLQALLKEVLGADLGVLDLKNPKSSRQQALALRATVALANEVLNPQIRPSELFVPEPRLWVQNNEGDIIGEAKPDGLLIVGVEGRRLKPEEEKEIGRIVDSFYQEGKTLEYWELIRAIKARCGFSSVQTALVEVKTVLGQRLNRSPRQLRQVRKTEAILVRELLVMAAVAQKYRNGEVSLKDLPQRVRVVYLRPAATRAFSLSIYPHDFKGLDTQEFDDYRGKIAREDQTLVFEAARDLKYQLKARDEEARRKAPRMLEGEAEFVQNELFL